MASSSSSPGLCRTYSSTVTVSGWPSDVVNCCHRDPGGTRPSGWRSNAHDLVGPCTGAPGDDEALSDSSEPAGTLRVNSDPHPLPADRLQPPLAIPDHV